jgi:hypothetical protein
LLDFLLQKIADGKDASPDALKNKVGSCFGMFTTRIVSEFIVFPRFHRKVVD